MDGKSKLIFWETGSGRIIAHPSFVNVKAGHLGKDTKATGPGVGKCLRFPSRSLRKYKRVEKNVKFCHTVPKILFPIPTVGTICGRGPGYGDRSGQWTPWT